MKLESLSLEYVRRAIEVDFGFSCSPTVARIAATAEQLRAAIVLSMLRQEPGERTPVATVSVTRPTRLRLAHVWPELSGQDDDNYILEQLKALEEIGDVVRAGNSWYLAPLRLIEVDSSNCLVLGGGPFQLLPKEIRAALQVSGRARVVSVSEKNRHVTDEIVRQNLGDWLGLKCNDLTIWAQAFQRQALKRMHPIDQIDNAYIYISNRWVAIDEYVGPSGICLFRYKVEFHHHQSSNYGIARLVLVNSGKARIAAVAEISANDARRLQGVICQATEPRRLSFKENGKSFSVRIPHPIPAPERRLLRLGWYESARAESAWPRDYTFSTRLLPLVRTALFSLGYELVDHYYR